MHEKFGQTVVGRVVALSRRAEMSTRLVPADAHKRMSLGEDSLGRVVTNANMCKDTVNQLSGRLGRASQSTHRLRQEPAQQRALMETGVE